MKDLAHHVKQLNRKIIRSMHRQELEEESQEMDLMEQAQEDNHHSERQLKKQSKEAVKKYREERTPIHKTAEEKNRLMKKRVPVFDRQNAAPKTGARKTHKKTPRI